MRTDRSEYLKAYRQSYKTRHKRVTVVYDMEEYRKIEIDAACAGVSIAAMVRSRSLEEGSPCPSPVMNKADDVVKELRFLLRNIANNINQMAYHSNRLRMVLDENEPLLRLRGLEDEIVSLLKRYRHDY